MPELGPYPQAAHIPMGSQADAKKKWRQIMVGALKEPNGLFSPKNEGRLFQMGNQGKQQPHTGRSQPGNEVMGRVFHAQGKCV